jgi:pimeloyl-[acyl-carrier protein] synthase
VTAHSASSPTGHPVGALSSPPPESYRPLREETPVKWIPQYECWVVTGYQQIRYLLSDPRVALSRQEEVSTRRRPAQPDLFAAREEAKNLFLTFMHRREAADHGRLRSLARPAFSPRRVAALRDRIQQLADERIDEGLARGRIDAVNELARPVALTIAAELLGIPESMHGDVGASSDFKYYMDVVTPPDAMAERSFLAMMALAPRLRELVARWRSEPPARDNLLWALELARSRGEMSEEEVIGHGTVFLFAGHFTTQHLIGNAVLALLRHPDQWHLLRERPELIETAVDEFQRFDTPAAMVARTALADIELGEFTITARSRILLVLAAAHRDPAVFDEPDRLDISRSPNPHLGFGHGAHYCLGAALGKLETTIVIGTLARRVRDLRLESEELEWENLLSLRGLKALPVLLS